MRNLLLFSIFIFIFTFTSVSQNYPKNYFQQPVDGELKVSGNFCEFRANHFHGGLDIRTPGNGYPIYAAADGYISRINVSSDGYGNSLYINHPNGLKTVYAHLNNFAPQIDKWFTEKQKQTRSFELDMELDSTIFAVKKGQIIAYSGLSGRSYGPHLHFEVRNYLDEPINPQLFNFNIPDSKAPEIVKIAVYPADANSYVNEQNYSSAFGVKYGKMDKNITVHGKIYFGLEAYDHLDNVSNQNAIYSAKLFIDGQLIYFSAFDKFSYDNNRDINSMVDYKRRNMKAWRIQKCFVEPNNQLYHYKVAVNNGVFEFNDNNVHEIKFIVADIYGNSSSLKFNITSTSKNINFKKDDDLQILRYDTTTTFSDTGIEIFFPENCLFDNTPFIFYTTAGNKYSPIYHIGSEYYPLKKPMIISISTIGIPKNYKEKTVIYKIDEGKDLEAIPGMLKENYITAEAKDFGRYYIDIDTIAPEIIPVNIPSDNNMSKYSSIKIKIKDNQSGIKNWATFINGNWVLSSYDKKNNLITYFFDENAQTGNNEFVILVSDNVNNTSTYKVNIEK